MTRLHLGMRLHLPGALPPILLLLFAYPVAGQDIDGFSDAELKNYRRFEQELIGRNPGLKEFRRAYEFILPLYQQFPQSEAYRIGYAQAISGFPATPQHARLHIQGLKAITSLDPDDFAKSGFMGILLLNLLERVSEDRVLLTQAARSDSVGSAFLVTDAVAASIFAYTLKMGTWHQVKAGSTDWTIRPGMEERRRRLAKLSPAERAGLPDWETMERTAWLPEAGRALSVLGPVLLDPRSYLPMPALSISDSLAIPGSLSVPDSLSSTWSHGPRSAP